MHMICYMSKYIGSEDVSDVLLDIKSVSVENNRQNMITGALFFHEGTFLQVIEGEEKPLRELMARISEDPRHDEVEMLIDTDVEKRGFSDWHMDSFHLGVGHKFNIDMMKKLTVSFEKNLLPRSDTLVYFYKTLLSQPTHKTKKLLSLLL